MLLRVGLLLLLLRCAAAFAPRACRARPHPPPELGAATAPSATERIVVRECFADEMGQLADWRQREEAAAEAADLMARGAVALGGGGGGDDDVALFSRVMDVVARGGGGAGADTRTKQQHNHATTSLVAERCAGAPPSAELDVVGTCSVTVASRVSHEFPQHVAYLSHLLVSTDARRCGVGGSLLTHAEGAAAERSCAVVVLFVDEKNAAARALYSASGYEFIAPASENKWQQKLRRGTRSAPHELLMQKVIGATVPDEFGRVDARTRPGHPDAKSRSGAVRRY